MARRFAQDTSVPVSRSQDEIRKLLKRIDADQVFWMESREQIGVRFRAGERQAVIVLKLPDEEPQTERMIWRHVVLYVKTRVTEIQEGISSFDEAFLPNIVLADGRAFKHLALPAINETYASGKIPELMSGL